MSTPLARGIAKQMVRKYPALYPNRRPRKLNQRQKKQVKRIVSFQQEKKYWPVYAGYTTFSATGSITGWSAIPVGDTASSRDGDRILLTYLDLRYSMIQTNTGAAATGNGRIIVFQYKNDNASAPITATVLDTSFTQPLFSPPIENNSKRVKILYDKTHALSNGTAGPCVVTRHVRISNFNKNLQYNAATTGYNQIYVLVIADAAINLPSWSYGAYLHYTDS